MARVQYKVIGVMSGTSLDGVDVVYVEFTKDAQWHFTILKADTFEYEDYWRETLASLVAVSKADLAVIDAAYTAYLAEVINHFIKVHEIVEVDAICSHGHTALHQPEHQLTYQIGNQPSLAALTKQQVVCDFRVQDVALGGQGAPLVPIGDALLFSEYDFCLNLGGFANISTEMDGARIAYDICPVNIVLNHYIKSLGLQYDDRGQVASQGSVNQGLLAALNDLEFYKQSYPKSLGLEWVNTVVFPLINASNLELKDVLRTFIEHIAVQISKEILRKNQASVLVTGGGVYNTFLMDRIKALSAGDLMIPANKIIEFKEALIFALLGVLRLRNEVNTLKSVTGAVKDHSAGHIFHH